MSRLDPALLLRSLALPCASLVALAAAGLGLPGCAPSSTEEDPWRLPESSGKADGQDALIAGDEIPSQFVDSDLQYLRARDIASISAVGPDEAVIAVLDRADGILDAQDHDGEVDAAELVRMEGFPHFALMTAPERDALEGLWSLYAVPEESTTVLAPEIPELAFEDRTHAPTSISIPSLSISAFPGRLHDTLNRIAPLFDEDGDPSTVALADLEAALGFTGAFTPQEVAHLDDARNEVLMAARTDADAAIGVTAPSQTSTTTAVGPVTIEATTAVYYEETQTLSLSHAWVTRTTSWNWFESSLVGLREVELRARTPAGTQLLLVDLDDGTTQAWTQTDDAALPRGTFLLEAWHDGQRTHAERVVTSAVPTGIDAIDLTEFRLHDLEALDGRPLDAKTWSSHTLEENRSSYLREYEHSINYRHDIDRLDAPGPFSHDATQLLSDADPGLRPRHVVDGRHVIEDDSLGLVSVDLYPQGAVSISMGGARRWMEITDCGRSPYAGWTFTYRADLTGTGFSHATLTDSLLRIYADPADAYPAHTHYVVVGNLER